MIATSLRSELAPAGKLRAGINYGNPVLAKRDSTSGALSGAAVDMAREIGRRTDLLVELVAFESAGKMVEGLRAGAWDIAFLAIDPGRAGDLSFTAPYVVIEGTYLVPAGSTVQMVEVADAEGVRIGVSANSAYDLFLSRSIKRARLVREQSPEAAFDLILEGKVDIVAGVRQSLMKNLVKLPGSRVLDGRFMAIEQAVGIVKGRNAAAKYLREFIEDVKASGFVARALENAGVRGVSVVPAASGGAAAPPPVRNISRKDVVR